MTAEQKAKQLIANFEKDSWHDATGFKGGSAERCALIAANVQILPMVGITCTTAHHRHKS